MIRNLFGGASKCRTIDKVDIFGDNSGKALYQLDGNANDTGGNYHGTETAITYGGGVYERGAVFNGTSSFIRTTSTITIGSTFTYSTWIKLSSLPISNAKAMIDTTSRNFFFFGDQTNGFKTCYYDNVSIKYFTYVPTVGVWTNVVLVVAGTSASLYINGVFSQTVTVSSLSLSGLITISGDAATGSYFPGSIDQLRIFNRAITATEVATLYAECAPTSIVDNINPFMDGSLKALYQFNGDATDATGVYNGTATNVTYGTGKFGQCAVFASGKVTTLYSLPTNTLSISLFYKASSLSVNSPLVCSGLVDNDSKLFFEMGSTNKVRFGIFNTTLWASSIFTLADLNWHFYTLTLSSSNVFSLYIDGKLDSTYTQACTAGLANIGYVGGSSFRSITGSIDQVRIFNKALTPLEVASLYNETTPLEEPMYKLVDPFKDGSGKALYRLEGNALDESGNYNGTATSVTYGAGQFGRCGVFNGSTSNITFNSMYSNTVDSEDLSVSLWFKLGVSSTYITFIGGNIANTSGAGGTYSVALTQVSGDTYKITCTRQVGTTARYNTAWTSDQYITSPINTWQHIVVTYKGASTKEMSAYFNGTLKYSLIPDTYTTTGNSTNSSLAFGQYRASNTMYNGSIDQPRFFNRVLTAGEVSKLYTGENNVL